MTTTLVTLTVHWASGRSSRITRTAEFAKQLDHHVTTGQYPDITRITHPEQEGTT